MRIVSILGLLFLLNPLLSAQITYIQQPDPVNGKDAMVWDDPLYNKAKRNYANSTEMLVHAWTDQGVPVFGRSYIAFDLSDYRHLTNLIVARLYLYNNPEGTFNGQHQWLSGPNNAVIRRVTQAWKEDELTWNNQPTSTTLHQAVIPPSTDPNQDYVIDVTELLQDILYRFPEKSDGFVIRFPEEQYYRALVFTTSDYHDATRRPKLELLFAGTTGVERYDVPETVRLAVYPNPANTEAHIAAEIVPGTRARLEVLNILGQQVNEISVPESGIYTMDVSQLNPGIHFLWLSNGDMQKTIPLLIR